MKQRIQQPVNRAYFWGLSLDQHNAQQHILNCIIESEVVIFLLFRKSKETRCILVEISNNFKRDVVSLSKVCRSKIFVTQWDFIRTLEIHLKKGWYFHKIFDNSHLKFGKMKKAKIRKQHFRQPVNRKPSFFTN